MLTASLGLPQLDGDVHTTKPIILLSDPAEREAAVKMQLQKESGARPAYEI